MLYQKQFLRISVYGNMNREVLIALIDKDIKELAKLTCGLSAMNEFPAPYMELAVDKAKALVDNLTALSSAGHTSVAEAERDCGAQHDVHEKALECIVVSQPFAADDTECEPCCADDKAGQDVTVETTAAAEPEPVPVAVEHKEESEPVAEEVVGGEEFASDVEAEQTETDVALETSPENAVTSEADAVGDMSAVHDDAVEEVTGDVVDGDEEKIDSQEDIVAHEEPSDVAERKATVMPVAEEKDDVPLAESVQHVTTVADALRSGESLHDTLSKEQDNNTIAASVAAKKIADLKTALTLADRFRFQRELFGGDGEKMMQALADFNAMGSIAEAKKYIDTKLSWRMDTPCVETFMALLERRYM